jgi:4,4'-diaponeurosporenoate glycosyltransferase
VTPVLWTVFAAGLLAGAALLAHRPHLGRRHGALSLSVIVPARDEAARLPALLQSLRRSLPPPLETIVVDDGSADATSAIARAAGAAVVTAPPLPAGWAGKPWACAIGAALARGDVLVFLDADVTLARDALARLAGEVERRGGLVSVQPHHRTERLYERLSAFFNLVGLMGVDAFALWRGHTRPAGAFGACLAVRRADYEAAGGHAAVRGEVLEDLALSRRFAAVTLFQGGAEVAFRMYPEGLGQLVEGWSKNIAAGAVAARPLTSGLVALWITACLLATIHPLAYAAVVAQLVWLLRRAGRFGAGTALAYPLPLAFFLAVFARSALLAFGRGRVRWKGRTIALGRGPGA